MQFVACDFLIHKKDTYKSQKLLLIPTNISMTPFILKNNYIKITLKKYTYKSENILTIPFYTKNYHVKEDTHKSKKYSHNIFFTLKTIYIKIIISIISFHTKKLLKITILINNHHILIIFINSYHTNIMKINIFASINQ